MEYEKLILAWADEKGILTKGTPIAQSGKMMEEATETLKAVIKGDKDEIKDGIGDVFVTICILAWMNEFDLSECVEQAYSVISGRTGKMVNGVFIKDK